MLAGIALLLLLIALPLQLLGLTSTCTQGADGTFFTGAVLSLLPLLTAVTLLVMAALRAGPAVSAGTFAAGAVVLLAPVMLFLTSSAWLGILLFGTPCGEHYAFYGPSHPVTIAAVLGSYVALPLAACGAAVAGVVRRFAS